MAYTINLSSDSAYICLTHTGETPFSEYEDGRNEAIASMQSHGLFKLLVDVRNVTSSLSLLEHFEFTSSHVEHLPRGVRTAILMRPDAADTRFIENVAVNRGITIRLFTDKRKAVEWLLESSLVFWG